MTIRPNELMAGAANTPDASVQCGGKPVKIWRVGTLSYTAVSLLVLFVWLLWGDFAWSIRDRTVGSVVQLLLRGFNASDTLTGILIGSIPAVLSMVITPVISYKSDRHRGRWGRRIPFLAIPTPFIALGMVFLAFSPQIGGAIHSLLGAHSPGSNHCVLISIGLSWTVFEVACIAANAVFGALINDVVPAALLGRFYGAFRALSLIAGIAIFYWVFGKAEACYFWIFLGIAVLYGVGFTLMCLNVKEGNYPDPPPMDAGRNTKGFSGQVIAYFQECFGTPYYRLVFITISLGSQMSMPASLFLIFYAKSLHMDNGTYGKCIALTYFCSLALSYPLGILADRFHPLRLSLITQFLFAAVCLFGALYVHNAWTFGAVLVATGVLNGIWLTVTASITQRMLPRAEFAQFSSAITIVTSILAMIIGPATGMLLDHFHHDYRYTFLLSFILTLICLVLGLILYGQFVALGGPKHYIAPDVPLKATRDN